MASFITDTDLLLVERQRKLRNGETIEHQPSGEEIRQAQAREVFLAREIEAYERAHPKRASVIGVADIADHLGLTEAQVEALPPARRMEAANTLRHERSLASDE